MSIMIDLWWSDYYQITVWWPSDDHVMTVWWPSDDHLMTVWLLLSDDWTCEARIRRRDGKNETPHESRVACHEWEMVNFTHPSFNNIPDWKVKSSKEEFLQNYRKFFKTVAIHREFYFPITSSYPCFNIVLNCKTSCKHYDQFALWDPTKKGQWALHAYSIANFVASWLKWL